MAFARFFNRASIAASQLIRGMSPDGFRELLANATVSIAFDETAINTQEGRWTVELLVNLSARLYPGLAIYAVGGNGNFLQSMQTLAVSINPAIDFVEPQSTKGALVVGETPWMEHSVPAVYAGSDGWQALVSHKSPRTCGDSCNPFGSGAAACLAAAQLFRTLFANQLGGLPGEEVSISLLDYSVNEETENDLAPKCDLDNCALVGVGAIGNAVLWALARCGVSGELDLVDPELIDETNPQRYILTDKDSPGKTKVELGAQALSSTSLVIGLHQMTWAAFVNQRLPLRLDLGIVALDTAEDRCAVQAAMPRKTLNAWTQAGDLGVSRHSFTGNQACLACLYIPTRIVKNEDQVIAEALNLAGDPRTLMNVRNALYFDRPLDDAWLEKISASAQIDLNLLQQFKNRPLRALYREGICGGIVVSDNGGRMDIEIPMAFQSAMAGIMLAAEIVKCRAGRSCDYVTTKLNLMRPLGVFLSEKHEKRADRLCFCQDRDYIESYASKYGTPESNL